MSEVQLGISEAELPVSHRYEGEERSDLARDRSQVAHR
jgi:hypothetical protein